MWKENNYGFVYIDQTTGREAAAIHSNSFGDHIGICYDRLTGSVEHVLAHASIEKLKFMILIKLSTMSWNIKKIRL
jgi:hypothetical protein